MPFRRLGTTSLSVPAQTNTYSLGNCPVQPRLVAAQRHPPRRALMRQGSASCSLVATAGRGHTSAASVRICCALALAMNTPATAARGPPPWRLDARLPRVRLGQSMHLCVAGVNFRHQLVGLRQLVDHVQDHYCWARIARARLDDRARRKSAEVGERALLFASSTHLVRKSTTWHASTT